MRDELGVAAWNGDSPRARFIAAAAGVPAAIERVEKRVAGTAVPASVIRDVRLGGDRATLAERLGTEFARIHGIRPTQRELAFLPIVRDSPAHGMIAANRALIDRFGMHSRPVPEWGLR